MGSHHVFSSFNRIRAALKAVKYYAVHMFRYPKPEDAYLDNSHFK